jgi:hypothetical protein
MSRKGLVRVVGGRVPVTRPGATSVGFCRWIWWAAARPWSTTRTTSDVQVCVRVPRLLLIQKIVVKTRLRVWEIKHGMLKRNYSHGRSRSAVDAKTLPKSAKAFLAILSASAIFSRQTENGHCICMCTATTCAPWTVTASLAVAGTPNKTLIHSSVQPHALVITWPYFYKPSWPSPHRLPEYPVASPYPHSEANKSITIPA